MANHDLYHISLGEVALNTGAITTNTTTSSIIIDTEGYLAVTFFLQSGTITDGNYVISMVDGDQANLSDSAAVSSDFILGDLSTKTFVASDDNKVKSFGYVGKKRYVQFKITSTSVTSGGTFSAIALLSDPKHGPAQY